MSELHVDTLSSAERVRVASDMGYFPVAVVTKDGAILVVFRAGAGHMGRDGYLVSSRSEDGGRTWSKPVVVVNTRSYDDRNPAVGVAQDGTVVVTYHANGMYGADGKYMTDRRTPKALHTGRVLSTNHGRSWGEPMLWTDQTPWDSQSPYGSMLTLEDGRMAMPIYLEKTWLLWSRDNGRTWGEHQLVADDINETAYCVLLSGGWLLVGRSNRDKEQSSFVRSSPDGKTWSEPRPFFGGTRHPSDLAVLGDGSVLCVFGYRNEPCGARARRSTDGGMTWSDVELVVHDKATTGDCGYPSAVRWNGWVVMFYYDASKASLFACDGTGCVVECVRVREDELIAAVR